LHWIALLLIFARLFYVQLSLWNTGFVFLVFQTLTQVHPVHLF